MVVGFLVPHRCDNPSLGKCVKCGRGFCDEHTNQTRDGRVCLACQQGLDMPIALPMAACNALGGWLGARMAILRGNKFIRIFFLIVVCATICRFAYDVFLK